MQGWFENLKKLGHQKQALNRSDLQVYFDSVRCTFEPTQNIAGRLFSELGKSDLKLFLQGDLVVDHQKKCLNYSGQLDEELAEMSSEQVQKLARCLVFVSLNGALSEERTLNEKFKILFADFVQFLHLNTDLRSQSDLDQLPDLFTNLVEFKAGRLSAAVALLSPRTYRDHFVAKPFNFRFLAKFKGLLRMEIEEWQISQSEWKEIVANCRFLAKIVYFSKKLEDFRNELSQILITKLEDKFTVNELRTEHQFKKNGSSWERVSVEKRIPKETFDSLQRMLDSFDQKGYLRKD